MNINTLSPLQRTQVAYAHFTLEEWAMIIKCVRGHAGDVEGTKAELPMDKVNTLLTKCPSAAFQVEM